MSQIVNQMKKDKDQALKQIKEHEVAQANYIQKIRVRLTVTIFYSISLSIKAFTQLRCKQNTGTDASVTSGWPTFGLYSSFLILDLTIRDLATYVVNKTKLEIRLHLASHINSYFFAVGFSAFYNNTEEIFSMFRLNQFFEDCQKLNLCFLTNLFPSFSTKLQFYLISLSLSLLQFFFKFPSCTHATTTVCIRGSTFYIVGFNEFNSLMCWWTIIHHHWP